MTEYYTHRNS